MFGKYEDMFRVLRKFVNYHEIKPDELTDAKKRLYLHIMYDFISVKYDDICKKNFHRFNMTHTNPDIKDTKHVIKTQVYKKYPKCEVFESMNYMSLKTDGVKHSQL